ncbi:hypothetical protein N7466_005477 [Penicillium verhagenii]|uniref:uncharacterized protein n=1 Tax=Penicillium verhagenii TaxID=1562060 RepID=UPI00254583F4|nr:uncharacterized protein N7466_005477 [Penicillium verhagenii]KAJ5929984.1 hypothetical protein N7466_005477 [Penicillium verhagenii]
MRVDSDFPLMEGVPAHRAACGMFPMRTLACAQFLRAGAQRPKSDDRRVCGAYNTVSRQSSAQLETIQPDPLSGIGRKELGVANGAGWRVGRFRCG